MHTSFNNEEKNQNLCQLFTFSVKVLPRDEYTEKARRTLKIFTTCVSAELIIIRHKDSK